MVMKSARGGERREKKAQAAEFGSFRGWGRGYFVLTLVGPFAYFKVLKISVLWFWLRVCICFDLKLVTCLRLCLNLILMTKN